MESNHLLYASEPGRSLYCIESDHYCKLQNSVIRIGYRMCCRIRSFTVVYRILPFTVSCKSLVIHCRIQYQIFYCMLQNPVVHCIVYNLIVYCKLQNLVIHCIAQNLTINYRLQNPFIHCRVKNLTIYFQAVPKKFSYQRDT